MMLVVLFWSQSWLAVVVIFFSVQPIVKGHSMEDGVFKAELVDIGNRCNLGTGAFVYYGVQLQDDATVLSDSYVMKGSVVPNMTVWGGNPANQLLDRRTIKSAVVELKEKSKAYRAEEPFCASSAG